MYGVHLGLYGLGLGIVSVSEVPVGRFETGQVDSSTPSTKAFVFPSTAMR